jgi:hypothetical protein
MRARGFAAAAAITEALEAAEPGATSSEVATAAGLAAEDAYDRIADAEMEQRSRTEVGGESARPDCRPGRK